MLPNALPSNHPLRPRPTLALLAALIATARCDGPAVSRAQRNMINAVHRDGEAAIASLLTVIELAAREVEAALAGRPGLDHVLDQVLWTSSPSRSASAASLPPPACGQRWRPGAAIATSGWRFSVHSTNLKLRHVSRAI